MPTRPRSTDDSETIESLDERLRELTQEYAALRGDPSPNAVQRRGQLVREMRLVRDLRIAKEPLVEVQVPALPSGHPIVIGDTVYTPGPHVVRASTAATLLWIISQQQQNELALSRSRSIDLDLSQPPAARARQLEDIDG